jgi:hypothetical protein
MERFFSYYPDSGIDWHETKEEAIEAAELALQYMRGDSDGVPEAATHICWGEVRGQVVESNRRTVKELRAAGEDGMADRLDDAGWGFTAEWALQDVEE